MVGCRPNRADGSRLRDSTLAPDEVVSVDLIEFEPKEWLPNPSLGSAATAKLLSLRAQRVGDDRGRFPLAHDAAGGEALRKVEGLET
jgi:hypothetical protein